MFTPTKTSVSSFITNLRLLNLDQLDDWPDVNLSLFAIRNARENQKQRIRCVEWALYKLFTLWSPKEAKNKLQPFFPPYESLRSLNLRAALLRCLTELKKDGILGKEIVIRKTMFDECRGEKFEDLLAFFSTIVLQKVLRSRDGNNRSIVGKIVTAPVTYRRDQKSLLPLAIAHRGALEALLRRKALLKSRYAELKNTLDAKERELLGTIDKLAQADQAWEVEAISERAAQDIQQRFEQNWLGSTRWARSILEGDREDFGDPLLDVPFSKVWTHTENGTLRGAAQHGSQGLLQNLTGRVRAQQDRLRHWQQVQQSLIESRPKSPIKLRSPVKGFAGNSPFRSKVMGSPLKFGHYNANGFIDGSTESQISPELKLRYRELLDLNRYPSKQNNLGSPMTPIPSAHHLDRYAAGMEEMTTEAQPDDIQSGTCHVTPSATILDGSTYCETLSRGTAEPPSRPPADHTDINDLTPVPKASRSTIGHDSATSKTPDEQRAVLVTSALTPQPAAGTSPTETSDDILAQQIIASALSSDPSPTKPQPQKISLMERTRQSMAFSNTESLLPDSSTYTPVRSTTGPQKHQREGESEGRKLGLGLVERTRRSISLLPTAASASTRRQARYPTGGSGLETPGRRRLEGLREGEGEGERENGVGVVSVVGEEEDYESVFMSRPRVANSPGLD
ncbi:MAG: hypothetical protein LQ350_007275 [Teloschistes chrysophthalmus]|nr:MAG: hypothetical protein LQ350_007275 [Niorma chrysophthalma]